MDLTFTRDQQQLREEIRSWLAANVPREPRPPSTSSAAREFDLAWQQRLWGGGWAGIAWPREYGGRGLDVVGQLIFLQEYTRASAPEEGFRFNGLNLAGPTIITFGEEHHKREYLPPILEGRVIWCQGFSEPGAGSDLAALQTRGVVQGDEIVINGHKIWTSYARFADLQQVLIRTDPLAARHRGLSWVICRMDSPGVTIRAIPDMAGGDDLHEVFYADVRVPLRNVVGGLGNGWRVAVGQLGFERGTAFMGLQAELSRAVDELIETARARRSGRSCDDSRDTEVIRDLTWLRVETRALQAMTLMAVSRNRRRAVPGAEGSMLKLHYSELVRRLGQLAMRILGPDKLNLETTSGRWSRWMLWSFGVAIGGGTSEIQRDIISERVLYLPRGR